MAVPRLRAFGVGVFSYAACMYCADKCASSLRESPENAFNHLSPDSANFISNQHVEELKTRGIVVIDNVLPASDLLQARTEITDLLATNFFEMNDNEHLDIRRDLVSWVYETICAGHENKVKVGIMAAIRTLRSVPHQLCLHGFSDYKSTSLGVPFVSQLACYNGGKAHYSAHRDAPPANTNLGLDWLFSPGLQDRRLTIILYLNDTTWQSIDSDGQKSNGNLRCYMDAGDKDMTGVSATDVINIEPLGGRLVIFDSKKVLHEVMPTNEKRVALTTWVGGSHSENSWIRRLCVPSD